MYSNFFFFRRNKYGSKILFSLLAFGLCKAAIPRITLTTEYTQFG